MPTEFECPESPTGICPCNDCAIHGPASGTYTCTECGHTVYYQQQAEHMTYFHSGFSGDGFTALVAVAFSGTNMETLVQVIRTADDGSILVREPVADDYWDDETLAFGWISWWIGTGDLSRYTERLHGPAPSVRNDAIVEIQNPVEVALVLLAEFLRDGTTLDRSYEICNEINALNLTSSQCDEVRQRANEMSECYW